MFLSLHPYAAVLAFETQCAADADAQAHNPLAQIALIDETDDDDDDDDDDKRGRSLKTAALVGIGKE